MREIKLGKDFKIWGIGYGLIGDIIMQLPLLTYFEKKYPGSYKYLVIEKKVSQCAPLFINHPLIDCIRVTENWNGIGNNDLHLARQCHITDVALDVETGERKPPFRGKWHKDITWYNHRDYIDESAIRYGIDIKEFNSVMTWKDKFPRLYKWFPLIEEKVSAYKKSFQSTVKEDFFKNNIAIWPFAGYTPAGRRNASTVWWQGLISALIDIGYTVSHFGVDNLFLSMNSNSYRKFRNYSFFDQVRYALLSEAAIGNDNGAMWIMNAYSHKCINLVTDYLPGHVGFLISIAPVGENSVVLVGKGNADNITIADILKELK